MKSVLWRVAKSLSYIEDARCLKANSEGFKEGSLQEKHTAAIANIFSICFKIRRGGTESLPEVKRPGRVVEHPSPSSVEVRRRVPSWHGMIFT